MVDMIWHFVKGKALLFLMIHKRALAQLCFLILFNEIIADRYDIFTKQWTNVKAMKVGRSQAAVATLEDMIYVMGGQTAKERTNSVECYDPKENKWKMVAPMTEARSGAQAAVSVGFLYVIGGSTTETVMTIEKYYPIEDMWSKVRFFIDRIL